MAPEVAHWTSPDGLVQTIRIVSKDSSGKSRSVQKMVIDSSCTAGSSSEARSSDGHGNAVAFVCAGAPRTAGYVRHAMAQARAQVAANPAIPASVRAEILVSLDREMAEAELD